MDFIRKIKLGWFFLLMGVVVGISGLSMTAQNHPGQTLLCFDAGCVYVQGVSSFTLGLLFIVVAAYLLFRR